MSAATQGERIGGVWSPAVLAALFGLVVMIRFGALLKSPVRLRLAHRHSASAAVSAVVAIALLPQLVAAGGPEGGARTSTSSSRGRISSWQSAESRVVIAAVPARRGWVPLDAGRRVVTWTGPAGIGLAAATCPERRALGLVGPDRR